MQGPTIIKLGCLNSVSKAAAPGRRSIVRGWRERRYAAWVTRALLKVYRDTAAMYPGVHRRALYGLVVIRYLGCTDLAAEEVLEGAEQSLAIWPVERELTFRDVVHYLAVTEYLSSDKALIGTQESFARVVALRVPLDL